MTLQKSLLQCFVIDEDLLCHPQARPWRFDKTAPRVFLWFREGGQSTFPIELQGSVVLVDRVGHMPQSLMEPLIL
jgi:hypothetical protein